MSNFLKLDTYSKNENKASQNIPNRVLESISYQRMINTGYPVTINEQKSLYKYVDCMHETRFIDILENYIFKVSLHEFELIKKITKVVKKNSYKNYGKKRIATSSLLRSVITYRNLKYLNLRSDEIILEIGPGCGYLGALLVADNHKYISTDIGQAFYIYQNNLMFELLSSLPSKMYEGAIEVNKPRYLDRKSFIHIPWWQFYQTKNYILNLNIKYIVANHILAEMHEFSLRFILKLFKPCLIKNKGFFVFEGWGDTTERKIWQINKIFADYGYVIPHNNVSGSFYMPIENKESNSLDFTKLENENVSNPSETYHPPIFTKKTEFSKNFIKSSNEYKKNLTITKNDLIKYFREASGRVNFRTDDEVFLNFINHKI